MLLLTVFGVSALLMAAIGVYGWSARPFLYQFW